MVDYALDTLPSSHSDLEIQIYDFSRNSNKLFFLYSKLALSTRINRLFSELHILSYLIQYILFRDLLVKQKYWDAIIIYQYPALNINKWLVKRIEKKAKRGVYVYLTNVYLSIPDNEKMNIITKYNNILTFDLADSAKYGFTYFFSGYSRPYNFDNSSLKYDIVFIGKDKGRLDELVRIYDYLTTNNVRCKFIVSRPRKKIIRDGINYINRITYKETLQFVNESRAILELLLDGQNGHSLRFYESIIYGRSLVTNNSPIENMDSLNPINCFYLNGLNNELLDFLKKPRIVESSSEIFSDYSFMDE